MNIIIDTGALGAVLYGIVSCHCPVTPETDAALFREFAKVRHLERTPVRPFLDIADANPAKTPLHLFLDFCACSKEDPASFTITPEDAVRYFCTRQHFDRMLGSLDPLKVYDPAAHLVSHMLLPVRLREEKKEGRRAAVYEGPGRSVLFRNVFVPPDVAAERGPWFGLHFGMALTALSPAQAVMAERHLGAIREFPALAGRVKEVDFEAYQGFGDHRSSIEKRFFRCAGGGLPPLGAAAGPVPAEDRGAKR